MKYIKNNDSCYYSCKFIIKPEEFNAVFTNFQYIRPRIIKRDPPAKEIFFEELFEWYTAFYNKLVSTYEFIYKNDSDLLRFIPFGISNDIKENDCPYPNYVQMGFFRLTYLKNSKIYPNWYIHGEKEKNILGIQINFQKKHNYKEEKICYEMVWKKIMERINIITNEMVLIINEKKVKTDIKISEGAKTVIKNAHFLKNNNFNVF